MSSQDAYDLTLQTGVSNLELERIISKDDDYYSYFYAKDVLKGRFELGEETISKDWFYSWCYALCVLKGRFRLGEKIIVKNAYFEYLVRIMGYNHD